MQVEANAWGPQCNVHGSMEPRQMGMRRSIDTNTRRANSAGPAPPPNPAPHGEHHISAKITLSLLWTFGQFPKDLEQIAIWWRPPQRKDQNATSTKKGLHVKGFRDSGIFFVLEGSHLHRPPYFVKPKLPGTEYFSEYSPLSLSSPILHLIIISKNGRRASF